MQRRNPRFPKCAPGQAWLYLLGRRNGIVKIGRTRNLCLRMRQHGDVEWRHHLATGSHDFIVHAEQACMRALGKVAAPRRRRVCEEFVGGLSRADAVFACRLAIAWARTNAVEIQLRATARDESRRAWQRFRVEMLRLVDTHDVAASALSSEQKQA